MRKLTKRQKAFIDNYCMPNSDSFGNASKSAEKSGYSAKCSEFQGSKLLKLPQVNKAISIKEHEIVRKSDWDLETKKIMARDNYLDSNTPRDKQFWWQEYCKLSGDYIQRIESTVEDKTKRDNEIARQEIRDYLNKRN